MNAFLKTATFTVLLTVVTAPLLSQNQRPAEAPRPVDVIGVEAQVVDAQGRPIPGLNPDAFEVLVDGKSRKVVSATSSAGEANPAAAGRVFLLAIDTTTFDAAAAPAIAAAAEQFVRGFPSTERIGVVTYPFGLRIDPTLDRETIYDIVRRLDATPARQLANTFGLRRSEVVALFGRDAASEREADTMRTELCRGDASGNCRRDLGTEAAALMSDYEQRTTRSITDLQSVLTTLGDIPGRKVLVLITGGVVVADRPGGRPNPGDIDVELAQQASRLNTTVYTLFADPRFLAASARGQAAGASMPAALLARDAAVSSRWLERWTGAAGGQLHTLSAEGGAEAAARVLRETSSTYLLAVEASSSDRNGRPHRIDVRLRQMKATVRSKAWAAFPVPVREETPERRAADRLARERAAAAEAPDRPARGRTEETFDLRKALDAAAAYVTKFDAAFNGVMTEERYAQTLTPPARRPAPAAGRQTAAGASAAARSSAAPGQAETRRRELKSDLAIVLAAGSTGDSRWLAVRDAFAVDGRVVREREDRLTRLLIRPDAASLARAAEIQDESGRHNIGAARSSYAPTLALEILRPAVQPRFRFDAGEPERVSGTNTRIVAFFEDRRPSIVRGAGNADVMSYGHLWIDPATGRVLGTQIRLDTSEGNATITTRYELDKALAVAVPVEMREEYIDKSEARTTAIATYDRFRKMQPPAPPAAPARGRGRGQ